MTPFENIDRVFAKRILGSEPSEKSLFALSYLFAACRQGHHCVSVKDKTLLPLLYGEQLAIEQIREGFLELPSEVIQPFSESLNLKPVVKYEGHFYLQKYFLAEQKILFHLNRLLKAPLKTVFSEELIEKHLTLYKDVLNEEQKGAIIQSLSSSISLLTGGPGTGKTYTVKYLLNTYLSLCKDSDIAPRILIAAPTGKASATLRQKLEGLDQSKIEIVTLHRALKIQRQQDLEKPRLLLQDLILVDECSMVDLHLWTALFSAIEKGSRVVLMGDPDQLPPVETGMIFQELLNVLPSSSLKVCMRTESYKLIEFASAVKTGDIGLINRLLHDRNKELTFYEFDQEEDVLKLSPWQKGNYFNSELKKRCLLSPRLEGVWGVHTLNERLHGLYLQDSRGASQKVFPIIITKTDYRQELYNGDTGVLVEEEEGAYALFESKGNLRLDKALLPPFQYAHALSVHKSQGSEYEEVFLFLPEGSQVFGREIIYTAITRAKRSVTIFAKKNILQQCLLVEGKKHSALSERIDLFN